MKRSEINRVMEDAIRFLQKMNFLLPPFSSWTPEEWKSKGPECAEIVEQQLGWDITDFGSGEFERVGLFLFTLRNGVLSKIDTPQGKVYAEKIMIVQEEQNTPTHFHFQKKEDIINRGGGNLLIQLWNSTEDEKLADTDVEVSCDGVRSKVSAGDIIALRPGESVCLPQYVYHRFWSEKGSGTVLVGEVSGVNDDHVDNRFLEPAGRFPEIEEDVPPLHLLCSDYKNYFGILGKE